MVTVNKDVKFWDVATGVEKSIRLTGYKPDFENTANSVTFNPAGDRLLIAACERNAPVVWSVKTGEAVLTLTGHTAKVNVAAYDPTGAAIVTGSTDATAKVWDAQTGRERLTLKGHTGTVYGAAFSPDGALVATASADQTLRLWDAKSGESRGVLRGHAGEAYAVAFSPGGTRLASAGWDRTVRVWDVGTREQQWLVRDQSSCYTADWSPDGTRLVVGFGTSVYVIDATRSPQGSITMRPPRQIRSHAFAADGTRLIAQFADKGVCVWDTATWKEVPAAATDPAAPPDKSVSPDGRKFLVVNPDMTISVRDAATRADLVALKGHAGKVDLVRCAWSRDGTRVAAGVSGSTAVFVWDAVTGKVLDTLQYPGTPPEGSDKSPMGPVVAFSPDGSRIVTASGSVSIWDAETGTHLYVLPPDGNFYTSALFSPDGRRIAARGTGRPQGRSVVTVWETDLPNGKWTVS